MLLYLLCVKLETYHVFTELFVNGLIIMGVVNAFCDNFLYMIVTGLYMTLLGRGGGEGVSII